MMLCRLMIHVRFSPLKNSDGGRSSPPPESRNYAVLTERERKFSLAADFIVRCWLDELDELEGLWLAACVAVDLA